MFAVRWLQGVKPGSEGPDGAVVTDDDEIRAEGGVQGHDSHGDHGQRAPATCPSAPKPDKEEPDPTVHPPAVRDPLAQDGSWSEKGFPQSGRWTSPTNLPPPKLHHLEAMPNSEITPAP